MTVKTFSYFFIDLCFHLKLTDKQLAQGFQALYFKNSETSL